MTTETFDHQSPLESADSATTSTPLYAQDLFCHRSICQPPRFMGFSTVSDPGFNVLLHASDECAKESYLVRYELSDAVVGALVVGSVGTSRVIMSAEDAGFIN